MKRTFLVCSLFCLQSLMALPQAEPDEAWDLVKSYQASTHVFYGEVSKILPTPNFKPGSMGVRLHDVDEDLEMPTAPIIWERAREFTFSIEAHFKETMPMSYVAYLPDPDLRIWIHVTNQAGDIFLVQPKVPGATLLQLEPGDKGLFFVRYFPGSPIPVLYTARLGTQAEEDLALLRAQRAADNVGLETIVQQARAQEEAHLREEATAFRVFEDEYYKILRIQDLKIRRILLKDLVERMGFTGLWNYFDFKERYLKRHGTELEESAIPNGPTEGREKLWHDISGELKKIQVILKAQSS